MQSIWKLQLHVRFQVVTYESATQLFKKKTCTHVWERAQNHMYKQSDTH